MNQNVRNRHAKELSRLGAAKGGLSRAKSLSQEERSEIARLAAQKRWEGHTLKATHAGSLTIGGTEIPCAVLEDGKRVVVQREVVGLLTGNKKGGLIRYLTPKNLIPYVPEKFQGTSLEKSTIAFNLRGRRAQGFEGEDLIDICKMYLNARKAGVLLRNQKHLADQAEIIVTAFAKVGITALIDEVTGYQEIRDRNALQEILDKYLLKELAAWAKRFPDEFYKEMFRLKNWRWRGMSINRPSVVGKYTNDLVYERLAPGILEQLQIKNPKTEQGYRKAKHHQWLTEDVGHPALTQHLYAVMGLMRATTSWEQFYRAMERAFPRRNTTPLLPISNLE